MFQPKMFTNFRLDEHVPEDNFYRVLKGMLDINFIRKKTQFCYARKMGRPSIDPVVFFKCMLVGYLENLCSDRALQRSLELRLDLRYFIDHDIDEKVPDHSTLCKTRQRIPLEIFEDVFNHIVLKCVQSGGTFDMYLASAQDQPWIDTTQDSVYGYQNLYMKVMAGSDRACQSTTMRGTNTDTQDTLMPAPVFNMDSLMAWTNHIYEKVGIQFQFTDYGVHHKNFDILDDDNAAIFKEAQELTLQYPFTEGWPINTSLRIFIFPDLVDPSVQGGGYSTLRGQAPKEGMFVMLDGNLMAERTLAHEIGHAVFGLVHQNEKTEGNDPGDNKITGTVTNDNFSLMTSGSDAASSKAKD